MVGSVWPRIIFESMYFSSANRANGAPEKSAEINDQIRRHAAHLSIQFFRPENLRADFVSVFIWNCFQSSAQLITHVLIIHRCDGSIWLAARDVEKNARIISAVAPSFCPGPINFEFRE